MQVIATCIQGFASGRGEPGSAGLDSGGAVRGTVVQELATSSGVRYQLLHQKSSPRPSCIIIYVFGGGFVAGSPDQYLPLTSQLSAHNDCWVAVPYYSLSTLYPVPNDQVASVAKHMRATYPRVRQVVGGESAGATIAAGVALRWPAIFDGVFLYSPWLDLESDLKTYSSRAFRPATADRASTGDPIFTTSAQANRRSSRALAKHYLGNSKRLTVPYANPIRADASLLRRLPPVLIFVGDRETILGGSERFMGKLQALGRTEDALQVYSGMWHVFPMYSHGCGSGHPLPQAVAALEQTRAFAGGAAPGSLIPKGGLPSVAARLVLLPIARLGLPRKAQTRKRQKGRKGLTQRKRRTRKSKRG